MKRLLLLLIICLPLSIHAQENQSQDNPFGVVEGFWFPEITCDLGVAWERIIFNWAEHQPTGAEDWYTLNVDDRWLSSADACDREVVALLKHTPAWATDGTEGVGVPRGLELAIDNPDNLWANFVRRAVDYYASRGVNHFIIWNEPDIDAETYGYEFEGDLEDYFQMLRVAYLVAKETNPSAVIHLAGTTYWHDVNEGRDPYMTRLVNRILEDPSAPEHHYYFDVLSLHIYFRTESVYTITNEMRDMLDSNGLTEHQIWINETNAAPTIDLNWMVERPVFNLDLQDQSQFLVQSAVLALAAGAERIAAYKLYDQQLPIGAESFGILSPHDASPRPAFRTWQMINERFNDVSTASFSQTDNIDAVQLVHENGQQSLVAWSRIDSVATIEISATSDKAYLLDAYGNITLLFPVEEVYTLSLLPARCEEGEGCFLGGAVAILVQVQANTTIRDLTTDNPTLLDFN
ncbi:MAG: hypothetical protein Phog2KO_22320 [Phototrophicaceae bacterium]